MYHIDLAARTLFYFPKEKIQNNQIHQFLNNVPDFPRILSRYIVLFSLYIEIKRSVNKINKLHFKFTLLVSSVNLRPANKNVFCLHCGITQH